MASMGTPLARCAEHHRPGVERTVKFRKILTLEMGRVGGLCSCLSDRRGKG